MIQITPHMRILVPTAASRGLRTDWGEAVSVQQSAVSDTQKRGTGNWLPATPPAAQICVICGLRFLFGFRRSESSTGGVLSGSDH